MEMRHEPENVQVTIEETTRTELRLSLEDEAGVFQTCGPTYLSYQKQGREDEEMEQLTAFRQDELDSLQRMGDELRQRAERAEAQHCCSQEDISQLSASLQAEKARVKQLWKKNCQQLADHEVATAGKDAEITRLRA